MCRALTDNVIITLLHCPLGHLWIHSLWMEHIRNNSVHLNVCIQHANF